MMSVRAFNILAICLVVLAFAQVAAVAFLKGCQ